MVTANLNRHRASVAVSAELQRLSRFNQSVPRSSRTSVGESCWGHTVWQDLQQLSQVGGYLGLEVRQVTLDRVGYGPLVK